MGKKKDKEKEKLINEIKKFVDEKFAGKSVFERSSGLWIKWHVKHKLKYPADFLCYTPEEFEKLKKKVSIVSEALKEGIEIK